MISVEDPTPILSITYRVMVVNARSPIAETAQLMCDVASANLFSVSKRGVKKKEEISPRKLSWPYLGHILGFILTSLG